MNVDEAWLLANGVDRETLDKALRGTSSPYGIDRDQIEIGMLEWDIVFEPVIRRDVRTWIPILGWRPCSLNEMAKSVKAKIHLKQRDRAILCEAARLAGIRRAMGKRQLSLLIRVPKGQRRWDADAFWKSTLDAAKHAGLIVDDGPLWFQCGPMTYDPERGPLRTTLIVEDLL